MAKRAIKAYHQVGTDAMEPRDRADLLDRVIAAGVIVPATERVMADEMWQECFGDTKSLMLEQAFREATPRAAEALREMAMAWIGALPEAGTRHTLFTCGDVVAGELDRIFMSVSKWYGGIPNGFVFDARRLILHGARFRARDLLPRFSSAIREVAVRDFDAVPDARLAIEEAVRGEIESWSWTGDEGVHELENCHAAKLFYSEMKKGCPAGEIVWEGRLPLEHATEAWREGKRLW